MKKALKAIKTALKIIITIPFIFLIFLFIIYFVVTPIVNNNTAAAIEKQLLNTPLPDNSELCDATSIAAKMVGNGNGMQYLGVLLIKSDLTLSELRDYYATYQEDSQHYLVDLPQDLQQELYVRLPFSILSSEEDWEGYYVVYSWGSGIAPFDELDLRGH